MLVLPSQATPARPPRGSTLALWFTAASRFWSVGPGISQTLSAVLLVQALGGGWTAAELPSSANVMKRGIRRRGRRETRPREGGGSSGALGRPLHVVGEATSHKEPGAVRPRLDRAQLDLQRLGDVGARESLDVVQDAGPRDTPPAAPRWPRRARRAARPEARGPSVSVTSRGRAARADPARRTRERGRPTPPGPARPAASAASDRPRSR